MKPKVGVQLYSVRESLSVEPYGTLGKIAEMGFKYVEAANHHADIDDGVGFGVPANTLRDSLNGLGISIVGCHINPLNLQRLPAILEYHQQLGNTQIGCDIEFYPYGNLDYVLRRCQLFNEVGSMCKEYGMRFYYHNHYQEFQHIQGRTVYDIIMANTDPSLVYVEMDTYWMTRGGANPIELIEQYKDRLVLLHQKDFPKNAPQPVVMFDGIVDRNAEITFSTFEDTLDPRCFAEIGTGILPIGDILSVAQQAPNLEYVLLEQDHTQLDEIESLRISMNAFRRFGM